MEGLPLPLEMRMMIYEILDYPSILQMRVLNSWLRDDIDENLGFRLSIKTSLIPTQSQTIKPLFSKKIRSVEFTSSVDGPEPSPKQVIHGWKGNPFVFKYPLFVKTLEFGSLTLNFKTGLTKLGFLSLLKDCHNLEKLVISDVQFHGRNLTQNQIHQLERAIQSFKRLQTLKLKFTQEWSYSGIQDVTLRSIITFILRNYQSSNLRNFEMDLQVFPGTMHFAWGVREPENVFLLAYPWITAFRLASRHWRTLKTLNLRINGTCSYEGQWQDSPKYYKAMFSMNDNSWKLFMEDFNKVTNLTELRFLHSKTSPFGRHTELEFSLGLQLVLQQRSLQELHFQLDRPIKFETLKQIVQNNKTSLKNVSVSNFLRSSENHENVIDMEIFYSCIQVETICIDFIRDSPRSRDFRIMNLRSLPSQLKGLALLGLCFPDDRQQLLEYSESSANIKSIELGFYPFQSTADLILIINNFVRNFSELECIQLKIVKPYARDPVVEGDDRTWEMEYSRLVALFRLFSSHEILDNPGTPSKWPYEIYHELTANMITSEDRIRILEYGRGN